MDGEVAKQQLWAQGRDKGRCFMLVRSPLACLYERQRTVSAFGIGVKILEIGVQVCSWSECGNDESIICLKLFSNQVSDSVMVIYIIQWPL